MKKFILSFIAITSISLMSFAQAPEAFKYQAVIRDAGGVILANQAVGVQLTIQQGSIGGTAVYTETFAPTSNSYGLVNLEIGTGTTSDDFSLIDWANGPYFMETAIDPTGGVSFVVMGTSQLMSVPYALHAKTAESVVGGSGGGPQFITPQLILDLPAAANISLFDTTVVDIDALLGFHPSSVILYYEHMYNSSASLSSVRARVSAFTNGITFEVCEHIDGEQGGEYTWAGNSGQFILPVGPDGLITLWSMRVRSDLNIKIIGYF